MSAARRGISAAASPLCIDDHGHIRSARILDSEDTKEDDVELGRLDTAWGVDGDAELLLDDPRTRWAAF